MADVIRARESLLRCRRVAEEVSMRTLLSISSQTAGAPAAIASSEWKTAGSTSSTTSTASAASSAALMPSATIGDRFSDMAHLVGGEGRTCGR
jgi:hypothetical protein